MCRRLWIRLGVGFVAIGVGSPPLSALSVGEYRPRKRRRRRSTPYLFLLQSIAFRGATAIKCWRLRRNLRAWYSLRLNSRPSALPSTGSRSNEESQMSKQGLPQHSKSRSWKHHPLRILQSQVWKAPSIPLPDLRKDLLLEHGYALLPTPTPSLVFIEVSLDTGRVRGQRLVA